MTEPRSCTSTCDLYDKYLEEARVVSLDWRSFGKRKRFHGRARTIQCFEDNSRVKQVLEQDNGRGCVLVVQAGGSRHCAILGDMIARAAAANEWEGVIVNGCVRDVDEMTAIDLGVLALGCTPRKSTRRGQGVAGVAVTMGSVRIQPNDWVFADNDGVVVIDPSVYEARVDT